MFLRTGMVGRFGATGLDVSVPALDLDFGAAAGGAPTLDPRFVFARVGSATYFDVNGLIQSAGTNVPRMDYDPYNHAFRGLYMEEARTNTVLQSGDFTLAAWAKTSCTLGAGTPGPNGATTGSGIISNAGAIGYVAPANFTPVAGTTYTQSVFVKAGSLSSVVMLMTSVWWADATTRVGTFNILTGIVTSVTGATASGTIAPVGNGWYRITMTATPDAAVAGQMQFARATANGDGTTIQHYAFGAQMEVGAFATSYIPTTTIAGARAIETCTMPVGSWFNQGGPGSLAIDWAFEGRSSTGLFNAPAQFVGAASGTDYIDAEEMSGTLVAPVVAGAGSDAASVISSCNFTPSHALTQFVPQRGASAWAIGIPLRAARAGVSAPVNNGNIAALPTITNLLIAGVMHFQQMTSGWTKRVRYWPRALTDTELLAATAVETTPTLELDFLNNMLDSRITFTRAAGPATYFDASGVLQNAGTNIPRFDYDPVTHAQRGLLIEEARTNQITNSADLSTGNSLTNVAEVVTTSATVAPDGVGRYQLAAGTAGTTLHYTSKLAASGSPPANAPSTFSAFLAPSGKQYIQMFMDDGSSNGGQVNIDTVSRTVALAPTLRGIGTAFSVSITLLAGNAMRVALTGTPSNIVGTGLRFGLIHIDTAGAGFATNSVGDGTSGILVWGEQLEAGAFATSYIPTTGVAATRAADVASMPIGPWFNPARGSCVADVMLPQVLSNGSNVAIVGMDQGAASDTIEMRQQGATTIYGANSFVASANKGGTGTANSFVANVVGKCGTTYDAATSGLNSVLNGGAASTTVTTGLPAAISRFTFGTGRNTPLNGYIRRVRHWPRVLSTAELQAETT